MPKAEVGSTKHLSNQMKAKGLQRLRWYCQICAKQCRDENGFKQHTQSESHVRAMLLVGEDPKKYIREYSRQFQRDFLQLLRASHGEKKVHLNHFYQEYIRDKQHVHMNATQWPSLTEFAKHLGREGLCRVEEAERGLEVQWIDDSADAIRRREEIKKMELRAKGDEEVEARLLEQQIRRAREVEREKAGAAGAAVAGDTQPSSDDTDGQAGKSAQETGAAEPVKVSLSLKAMAAQKTSAPAPAASEEDSPAVPIASISTAQNAEAEAAEGNSKAHDKAIGTPAKVSLSLAQKAKPVNLLAGKKNPLAAKRDALAPAPQKKMSNAERIMKEEMERKRMAAERAQGGGKRQRLA